MQKNALFSSIFFFSILVCIFTLTLFSLGTTRIYDYTLHRDPLHSTPFARIIQKTASLNPLDVVYSYVQSGSLSFDAPRTTVYFSIKPHFNFDSHDDITVEWYLNGERYMRFLDFDGVVGPDEQLFTFPFVANQFMKIDYVVTSRIPLTPDDIQVISANNQSYKNIYTLTPRSESVQASDEITIISRSQWGADEGLRYVSDTQVKKDQQAYIDRGYQPKVIFETEKEQAARARSNSMFDESRAISPDYTKTITKTRSENGQKLVWPIETVRGVQSIIIHHTAESMQKDLDDMTLLRAIYQYHAVSRGWGDIGYNYIIGQRGQIYEGRAGGDYVVGAHAAWNNAGSVGISVMGDFSKMTLNKDQEAELRGAIIHFAKKYGIDIRASVPGVRECKSSDCGNFQKLTNFALMGHRDVGVTNCPGDNIYAQLEEYRETLPPEIGTVTPIWNPRTPSLEAIAPEDGVIYAKKGGEALFQKPQTSQTFAQTLSPHFTLPPQKPAPTLLPLPPNSVLPTGPGVTVKLSYPNENTITLQSATKNRLFLVIDKRRILIPYNQPISITTSTDGFLDVRANSRMYRGKILTIEGSLIRIESWNRVPLWDTLGRYNDNIFRTKIQLQNESGKLLVLNTLPLEFYLRGMGEVSEGDAKDTPEKAKTIIVGARSYARYYSDPNLSEGEKKFPGKSYQLSDDPDVSQKYLGYGYEMRSPTVAALVDMTNGEVVTYNGKIIKVWYSSSTDGRTRSYLDYCKNTGKVDCEDIPYLQSVDDPGALGMQRNGHGVGVSGIGATYFAKEGWDYKKILGYYLLGTMISKQ